MVHAENIPSNVEFSRHSLLANARGFLTRRRPGSVILLSLLLLAFSKPNVATATITTISGSSSEIYQALPAQFGAEWLPGISDSEVLLRYLPDNPLLCHPIHDESESLVLSQSFDNTIPLAYLAKRGSCPYYEKAMSILSFSRQIKYLIIFHDEAFEPDAIISMSAPKKHSPKSLHILSTSYNTGQSLIQYMNYSTSHDEDALVLLQISKQEVAEAALMKPKPVRVPDYTGTTSQDSPTQEDDENEWNIFMSASSSSIDRDLLNPTMGVFFTMLLLASLFLLCLVAANPNRRRRLRLTLGDQSAAVLDTVESCFVGHNLVTSKEVQRYLVVKDVEEVRESASTISTCDCNGKQSVTSSQNDIHNDIPSIQCAICIEVVLESEDTVRLPCNHTFHSDCIVPWLTERNGTCPLCKYDVHRFVQESAALDFSLPANYMAGLRKKLYAFWGLSSQRQSVDTDESIEIEVPEMAASTSPPID